MEDQDDDGDGVPNEEDECRRRAMKLQVREQERNLLMEIGNMLAESSCVSKDERCGRELAVAMTAHEQT